MRSTHDLDLDLNLLVSLDVLIRERSVTRAARRLGLTQPAMSHRLRVLREQLGDPLLVGARSDLQLTERARQIAEPLGRALVDLRASLRVGAAFDPATSTRTFRVVAGDVGELVVIPTVVETLREQAPGVRVVSAPRSEDMAARLASGELDLVVGEPMVEQAGLARRVVGRDPQVVLARQGHPALHRGRLSLRDYVAASHVTVTQGGPEDSQIDGMLAGRGLRRQVAVQVSHFVTAPYLLLRSDLLYSTGESVARAMSQWLPLVMVPHPLDLPIFDVTMTWHERSTHDPAHSWLRELAASTTGRRFPRPSRARAARA